MKIMQKIKDWYAREEQKAHIKIRENPTRYKILMSIYIGLMSGTLVVVGCVATVKIPIAGIFTIVVGGIFLIGMVIITRNDIKKALKN